MKLHKKPTCFGKSLQSAISRSFCDTYLHCGAQLEPAHAEAYHLPRIPSQSMTFSPGGRGHVISDCLSTCDCSSPPLVARLQRALLCLNCCCRQVVSSDLFVSPVFVCQAVPGKPSRASKLNGTFTLSTLVRTSASLTRQIDSKNMKPRSACTSLAA